jgi:hypothetical protein
MIFLILNLRLSRLLQAVHLDMCINPPGLASACELHHGTGRENGCVSTDRLISKRKKDRVNLNICGCFFFLKFISQINCSLSPRIGCTREDRAQNIMLIEVLDTGKKFQGRGNSVLL